MHATRKLLLLLIAAVVSSLSAAIPHPRPAAAAPPNIDTTVEGVLQRLPNVGPLAAFRSATPLPAIQASGTNGQLAGWEVPLGSPNGPQTGYAIVMRTPAGGYSVSRIMNGSLQAATNLATVRATSELNSPARQTQPLLLGDGTPAEIVQTTSGYVVDSRLDQPGVGLFGPSPTAPSPANAAGTAHTALPRNAFGNEAPAQTNAAGVPTVKYIPNGEGILQMPYFAWDSGCTPTAQEMIEAYWSRDPGLGSLFPTIDYAEAEATSISPLSLNGLNTPDVNNDILQMAAAMKTDPAFPNGTEYANMGPGIAAYESARGVHRPVYTEPNPTLSNLTSLIDNPGVPILGSFDGIDIQFPWSPALAQLERQLPPLPDPTGLVGYAGYLVNYIIARGGYSVYSGSPTDHSIAITGYLTDGQGSTYMIAHDDAKADADALILWNGSWFYSQFNYTLP